MQPRPGPRSAGLALACCTSLFGSAEAGPSASAPLWTSPIVLPMPDPQRIVIEGTMERAMFKPYAAHVPAAADRSGLEAPVPVPLGEELVGRLLPRTFGVEERAAATANEEDIVITCRPGRHAAGILLPLPGRIPAGARTRLKVVTSGTGKHGFALIKQGMDATSTIEAALAARPQALHLPQSKTSQEGHDALVVVCPFKASSATISSVHLQPNHHEVRREDGTWIWNPSLWLARPKKLAACLVAEGMARAYLQLPLEAPDLAKPWLETIKALNAAGIAVHAVEGDPTMIEPLGLEVALHRATALRRARQAEPDLIAGVQYDIEPYLRPAHRRDPAASWQAWANALTRLARAHADRVSVVVPFWMMAEEGAASALNGLRPVLGDLVVMAYRTETSEIEQIAASWLNWGVTSKIPVRIALERASLPVEVHRTYVRAPAGSLVLKRERDGARIDLFSTAVDGSDGVYAFSHDVVVDPKRISFAANERGLFEARKRLSWSLSAWPSFAGLAIHELITSTCDN